MRQPAVMLSEPPEIPVLFGLLAIFAAIYIFLVEREEAG